MDAAAPSSVDIERIRRHLKLGCIGLIALPYTLALALLLHHQRGVAGLLVITIPIGLTTVGAMSLGTKAGRVTALVGVLSVALAVVALPTLAATRVYWIAAITLAPGLLALTLAIALVRHQLLGTIVMLLLGGSLTVLAWIFDYEELNAAHGISLALMGFGFTTAGPGLLTLRPLPPGAPR